MAVYGIYVPTARTPTSGLDMECFPSREQTGRCLLNRCQLGADGTWYLRDGTRSQCWPRPVQQWADADDTGYMRVFLRYAADPVPGLLDEPDEEWLVNPGGKRGVVVRLPWQATDGEAAKLAGDGVRILPSSAVPARPPARPARRLTDAVPTTALMAPPRAVCTACFQERHPTAGCGCPDTGADAVMEIQRPARTGWEQCVGCGKAVSAYARCGCS